MPVQLEWEIEDDETSFTETEPVPEQPPRPRRWLRLFALGLLVVAVGLGFLWYKARQKHKEVERELRAAIQLELSALRDDDRDLFLSRQDPNDIHWRRIQEEAFDDYHRPEFLPPWEETPEFIEYTGEIPTVHVQGDMAWAQVELARGEKLWRAWWFFRWNRADGWRHVGFDEDWLGEQRELETPHLRFTYPQRDAAIVEDLADRMETWYETVAPVLALPLTGETLMTVQFAYRDPMPGRPLETRWTREGLTLQAPSPHQGHLSADGSLTTGLLRELAGYLAQAFIAEQAGLHPDRSVGPVVDALRAELRDWAVARMAAELPDQSGWHAAPTPLLDALVARDGLDVVPPLAASLHEPGTLEQILAASGIGPPDPMTHLAFYLAAVNRAFYSLDEDTFQALLDPSSERAWREYQRDQLRRRRADLQTGRRWPEPASFSIRSVQFHGSLAWVEAETTWDDGRTHPQAYFFREVNDGPTTAQPSMGADGAGAWLLTSPDPAYFGPLRTTRTQNLVFEHFERDADWFEDDLTAELQTILSRAAADLGISTDGLVITVTTELRPGIDGLTTGDGRQLSFTSPSVSDSFLRPPRDRVTQMAFPLLAGLFETHMLIQGQEINPYLYTYIAAFIWELERLFPEGFEWEAWLGVEELQTADFVLDDLWVVPVSSLDEGDPGQLIVGYRILIEYLAETYGPEVVPAMLDNLARTDELDEWLRLSTGHGLQEIEPGWEAWLSEHYGAQ